MRNLFLKNIVFSTIVLFAVSCSQSKEIKPTIIEEDSVNNTNQTSTQVPNSAITEVPNATVNPALNNSTPITVNPSTANATPVANVQTKPQVAKGMNPAHGEPNHRCDIAVGAPLNSPPGKQQTAPVAAPVQQVSPQTVTPANTPGSVPNPMNLAVNPAHGEPGHSCAIAVGAAFK